MKKQIFGCAIAAFLLAAGSAATTSCSGNTDSTNTETHVSSATDDEQELEVIHAAVETPEDFKNNFQAATTHYLALKDALVESKAAEAQQHAAAMATSLKETAATAPEGAAAAQWQAVAGALTTGAAKIAATNDLGEQRIAFTNLSENMISAVQAFGAGTTLYRQYCPMANRNAGGSWLSSSRQVRNPYYGDAMLACGEVQAAIQDKQQ